MNSVAPNNREKTEQIGIDDKGPNWSLVTINCNEERNANINAKKCKLHQKNQESEGRIFTGIYVSIILSTQFLCDYIFD